jgi:hypothetical protein
MQGMAQQMQQMMGQGDGTEQAGDMPGDGTPQGRSRASERDNDPLGRPTRSRDFSDGRVKVPTADESAVQRARRIMEELRRKLGDPSRPREELDYFDRCCDATEVASRARFRSRLIPRGRKLAPWTPSSPIWSRSRSRPSPSCCSSASST